MSEQLGESLSALMDGEASERDIERVLDNLDDPELRSTWSRLQAAGQSLQAGSQGNVYGVDVSGRIMAALEEEPELVMQPTVADSTPTGIRPVGRWHRFSRPLGSLAVAASVCAAVLIGTQYYGGRSGEPGANSAPVAASERLSPGGVVSPLGGAAVRADFSTPGITRSQPVSDYDAIARDRLQRYLLPHTEEATLNGHRGMMPFARVASFETGE